MFAIRVRVSPCNARSPLRSVGRETTIVPSCCSTFIRAGTSWESSPSGPFTMTRAPVTETFTPDGISMGCFPIRLIDSPDEADDLAAYSSLLRRPARDEAARRGQDRRPHAAQDAWQPVLACVDSPTRLRDPAEVGDDPLAVPSELELDDERVVAVALADVVIGDVALLLEQARDLLLQAGRGHLCCVVERLVGVPDPRQHVGNGIGVHLRLLPGRFGHAGNGAFMRELAQADPAQAELAVDRARAPAAVAARVLARAEAGHAGRLGDQGLLSQRLPAPLSSAQTESRGRRAEPGPPRRPRLSVCAED